jgi:nucleotide-binding universal stress UspA family protein
MFGNIIVATDLQPSTRLSLRAACDMLRSDGELVLVHVIRRMPGLPDAEADGIYDRLKALAGARLLDLASWSKRERGVDIACLTLVGSPGRELVRLAAERGADLIVLAHDPADDPATLGSVSYQVAHLAPCAVLVLKTDVFPGVAARRTVTATRRKLRRKEHARVLPGT